MRPIDIWPQVFAAHRAVAFAVDVDGQINTAGLIAKSYIGQMLPAGRTVLGHTPARKRITLLDGETHEVGLEFVHANNIHRRV